MKGTKPGLKRKWLWMINGGIEDFQIERLCVQSPFI